MNAADEAATELAARRLAGRRGPRLPAPLRPLGTADALVIQRRVAARLGAIGGWKCSVPAGERINVAPLFSAWIHRGVHATVNPRGSRAAIEPEVAFVLGRDLPARGRAYEPREILEAVSERRLAIELIGNRYDDPDSVPLAEILADGANNQGLVVGPVIADAGADLTAFAVTVRGAGGFALDHAGRHPDGDPQRPLVWLANFLTQHGDHLRAGQIVTTGSYAGVLDVPLATPLTVTFGTLGQMQLTLDPAR
jgi:2-keto-4-pentenoate hydratase